MMVMLNAIQNKFQNALARLENLDNINFYFLPLEKFALTDELYIKMNHRGKQLTEFEIFKAQIAECLPKLMRKDIMKLFDQKYTDYFWSIYKTYKETFDNEMLNFLRFAFFIDYYKKHGSFEDYIIKSEEAKEKSEETHEETTPQNKSEKNAFMIFLKDPAKIVTLVRRKKIHILIQTDWTITYYRAIKIIFLVELRIF